MASKYLQKYPVPAGFQEILHDFTRQVLRDQPPNIIEYAAKYFEMLEKGKKFEYESKFNVKKDDRKNQMQYNPKAAEDITKKATGAVTKINAGPDPGPREQNKRNPAPSIRNIDAGSSTPQESNQGQKYPASTNTLIKQTGKEYVREMGRTLQEQHEEDEEGEHAGEMEGDEEVEAHDQHEDH